MVYRDLEGALGEERRTLIEEIERLDAERARLESNLCRQDELTKRLREVDARLRSKAGEPSRLLDTLTVASPCSARWEDMIGDSRVRFCSSCAKNVYDLSSLTEDEIRELIAQTDGEFCGRLRQRVDGRVLNGDCPVGVRRKRRRTLAVTAVAAAGAAAGVTLQAGDTQLTRAHHLVIHEIERTEVKECSEPSDPPAVEEPESCPRASRHHWVMGGMRRRLR